MFFSWNSYSQVNHRFPYLYFENEHLMGLLLHRHARMPIISPHNIPNNFSHMNACPKNISPKKQYPNTSQYIHHNIYICTGWWFGTFYIFHNIWDNPSHWLIFFKMVKTTNQYILYIYKYWIPLRFLWDFNGALRVLISSFRWLAASLE